ncbi:DUF4856 domain-containing protein [Spongiimicrobium salis]|uniref:DUF4856 domain-containing protein n=1 Tax=Spongiimicrobium salis TaxID=1667022 RepID=UPI00374D2426
MRIQKFFLVITALVVLEACSSDDDGGVDPVAASCSDGIMNGDETGVDCGGSSCTPCETGIENPTNFVFERDGVSTVSFSGQTTRILMGEELLSGLRDDSETLERLRAQFTHQEGNADFEDADLNASDKNVIGKTAASNDFFSSNATVQAEIRAEFDGWIETQVNDVFPNFNNLASAGVAGQLADGSSTRYVAANGLEFNQVFNKSLIGALMVDQILNNYISADFLDAGTNRADNDNLVLEGDNPYTGMEHDWDEAYGYAYGTAQDLTNPNPTIGDDDSFLNKYIGRVENDPDFAGIADDIFQAYKLGRAAIVANDYELRDQQATILRQKISEVVAIRAVFYLQQGKLALENDDFGGGFHDLSEGYGFIYSLQFTRMPGTNSPFFTRTEVNGFLADLLADGPNGLWDLTSETLDAISEAIAAKFDFTVAQAGSTE